MAVQLKQVILKDYRLPLRQPLKTALGLLSDRAGIVVRVVDTEGRVGLGEAAPLDGFGMESLVETRAALNTLQVESVGKKISDLDDITTLLANFSHVPAAKHGMELALCNLWAISQAKSLAYILNSFRRDSLRDASRRVTVNALIGGGSPEIAAARAQALVQQGYTCIKVKVGTDGADGDWQRVAAVRAVVGKQIQIRLDANQAWSVDEAIARINQFESLDIEYIEQPVAASDLAGMAKVRRFVGIAIAADESITNIKALQQAISYQAADIAIIKPMAMGGILTARKAAYIALEAGMDVVFTTTIDGAIARLGTLHLAASIPEVTRACGLATGELLESDLLPTFPVPERGAIAIPQ
jgi:o-succinylbenzoate synthase